MTQGNLPKLVVGFVALALAMPALATSKQPLRFEASGAGYAARGNGYTVSVTGGQIQIAAGGETVTLQLAGGGGALNGSADAVRLSGVYPGIDVSVSGYDRQLTLDLAVAAGADLSKLMLRVSGAQSAIVDGGNVTVTTAAGKVTLLGPAGHQRGPLAGRFTTSGNNTFSVNMGTYDVGSALTARSFVDYSMLVRENSEAAASPAITAGQAAATAPGVGTNAVGQVTRRPGFVTTTLPRNDDGSAPRRAIGFPINFFGENFENVYVNNNGNFTFENSLGTYTPFDIYRTGVPIVAAFFGDVDTRNSASGVVTYGDATVNGRPAFGANYFNVGFYSSYAHRQNTFQIVLINRSDVGRGDFDIELNYDQIQWEAGTASGSNSNGLGGSPARVGYSNGIVPPQSCLVPAQVVPRSGCASFEVPASGVSGAFLDTNTSTGLIYNTIGTLTRGRYLFPVRNGLARALICSGASANGNGVCGNRVEGNIVFNQQTITFVFNVVTANLRAVLRRDLLLFHNCRGRSILSIIRQPGNSGVFRANAECSE